MPLFNMEFPDMRLQMGAVVGSIWTVRTLERPFTSVYAHMSHQIELLQEGLATKRAGMTNARGQPLRPGGRGWIFHLNVSATPLEEKKLLSIMHHTNGITLCLY